MTRDEMREQVSRKPIEWGKQSRHEITIIIIMKVIKRRYNKHIIILIWRIKEWQQWKKYKSSEIIKDKTN